MNVFSNIQISWFAKENWERSSRRRQQRKKTRRKKEQAQIRPKRSQNPQSLNFTRRYPSFTSRTVASLHCQHFRNSFRPGLGTFAHFRVTKLLLLTHLVIRIYLDRRVNTQLHRILPIFVLLGSFLRSHLKRYYKKGLLTNTFFWFLQRKNQCSSNIFFGWHLKQIFCWKYLSLSDKVSKV